MALLATLQQLKEKVSASLREQLSDDGRFS